MKKCVLVLTALVVLFFWQGTGFCATTQVDALIEKLVEKNVITREEALKLKTEIVEDEKIKIQDEVKQALPDWVKNMEWKGDLRLRNELIDKDPGKGNDRQRIRLRYGFKSKVNDKVSFSAGLASGSDNATTSTNQTLEQEFDKKPIWIDYAYINYDPTQWLNLKGGRIPNPFFTTDMVWDSDINFDGGVFTLKHALNDPASKTPLEGYFTSAFLPIDNRSTSARDLWLMALQGGVNAKFADFAQLKSGLAFYNFHSLEGYPTSTLAQDKGTNSASGGNIKYDFNIINPTLELEFKNPFGLGVPLAFIGDFAENNGAPAKNQAWRAGIAVGKKIKGIGDWRLLGQYSRIAADALFDAFPDSDFDGGGTNAKGWEVIFDYGLAKNVTLSLDYYNTEPIVGTKVTEQVIQTDLVFKF
ncbi:MAG: putative porin [Candidatus Omnitrophota bacterium]|nr:putative porin [Candidatus Omnitrophota bacterium]